MKKIAAVLFSSSVLLLAPSVSFAAINTLNGLNGRNQTFSTGTASNSPHLLIQSSGTTHNFTWDGTPWSLRQGGTGATSFATSSIPFINNGVFSQNNLQFFWDAVNNILNVGGSTTPATKLSVRGSGSLGLFNVASSTGSSLFYISGAGNVGIGNTNPQSTLDVSGAVYSRMVTLSPSSTVNVDWNAGNVQSLTLTSDETLTFTNGQAGGEYKLILKQDATGGRMITWPSAIIWERRVVPILTSTASSIDLVNFIFDGSNYLASFSKDFGVAPVTVPVQVLLVGGGGGGSAGANGYGAGGGGGEVIVDNSHNISAQTYSVTVGIGGGGTAHGTSNTAESGFSSTFDTLTAVGGGGATSGAIMSGDGGASGNGHRGGIHETTGGGGGGGGDSQDGQDGVVNGPNNGGNGGNGTANSISGSSSYYGGGGGGAGGTTSGSGGLGGGGNASGSLGSNGTSGSGGGGGGGGDVSGGNGGSGIVIISAPENTITATGGIHTTSNGNDIWTFTSSGTFIVASI